MDVQFIFIFQTSDIVAVIYIQQLLLVIFCTVKAYNEFSVKCWRSLHDKLITLVITHQE